MNIGRILPEKEFGKFTVVDFSKPHHRAVERVFKTAEQKGVGVILKNFTSATNPKEKLAVLSELDKGNEVLQNNLSVVASIGKAWQKIKASGGLPVDPSVTEKIVTQTRPNIPVFIAEKAGKTPSDIDKIFLRDGRVFGFLNYEA